MLKYRLILLISLSQSMAYSMPTVHTIGDSHSFFSFSPIPFVHKEDSFPRFFNYDFYHHDKAMSIEFALNWIGARTMHWAGKDGSNFVNLKNFGVQENDCIVFVFGEIDARCHILKQAEKQNISIDEIITKLGDAYLAMILNNKNQYNNLHGIIFAVLPHSKNAF